MLRPWKLNISIARDSDVPIHVQIAEKIIEEIQYGRFVPGTVLPGTREFSNRLNINRKTVVQAYDTLVAQGWLTTENKRGTFVSGRTFALSHHTKHPKPAAIKLAKRPHQLPEALIQSTSLNKKHDGYDLSEDIPDSRLLPFEALSRAMRRVLVSGVRHNKLHYQDAAGAKILREAVMQMVNLEQGLYAELGQVCITRGSQMAVHLAAKLLVGQDDCVAVEALCNPLVNEMFVGMGAKVLRVKHDHEGVDLESFETLCINHPVRVLYVSPQHQIPTGAVMSMENRKGLLKLAEKYDVVIIEDDSHGNFCFGPQITPPLASLDKSGRVIYIGSLSRLLAPGLRLGYLVSTQEFVRHLANQIAQVDRHGNTLMELAVAELMLSGEMKRHSLKAHKIYFDRRVHLLNLINQQLSFYCTPAPSSHGLSVWLNIFQHVDIQNLLLFAEKEKLRIIPSSLYTENRHYTNGLRLCFGHLDQEEITDLIYRLKLVFKSQSEQLLSA